MPSRVHDLSGLSALDASVLGELRSALRQNELDGAAVSRAETIGPRQLDAVRLPLVLGHLRKSAQPSAVMMRLFVYDDAVDRAALDPLLGRGLVDRLLDAKLLERSGDDLTACFRIIPYGDLLFIGDDVTAEGDPVMGPGATTPLLGDAVRARPGERFLDVGTGAGTFALLAAKEGADATGIDLNPRAIAMCEVNAKLNGLSARFLAGDLFAPVAGERFDLVVAQPPFVLTPPDIEATTYLHGGAMGDELTMRLLSELPPYLASEGRALVLFDSADRRGAPVIARVREAISDEGLQIFSFVARGAGADEQACAYAAARHPTLGAQYADAVLRYRAHCDRCGIESSSRVLLWVSRPRVNEPAFAVSRPLDTLRGLDPEALERAASGVIAASRPDAELLERAVSLPKGARFVEERAPGGEPTLRVKAHGLADRELNDASGTLLELLAIETSVGTAVERFAEMASAPAAEMQPQVLAFVRESLAGGLLELRERAADQPSR
jgi:methylase of polypeptide subunit release factors